MSAARKEPQQDIGTRELLASLESVVMDLNDMENMIENFEESAAESFFAKVNEYIANLKEVEKKAPACHLQVPREALERIDDDLEQNPELFAHELLTRCKDESEQLNARVLGIKRVRQTVMDGWKPVGGGHAEEDPTGRAPEPNGNVAPGERKTGSGGGAVAGVAPVGVPMGIGGKAAPGYSA
ncbi:unnamed protein product [Scytosiphon promiscuus]